MTGVPETMRVARLHAWGDVRVEEVPVPRPGPGEALVRVAACGVCGSDALVWYVERKAPTVLGHEPAGEVVAVGEGTVAVRTGERVFVHHHAPCMRCAECRRSLWSNCATWRATALDPGGFAEYMRVPATNVERDTLVLPDAMDWTTATFIEPLACALRALGRQGGVQTGDAVAVIGLGGMGLLLVQAAGAMGAGTVVGTDFLPDRRELARELGAAAVDAGSVTAAEEVRTLTGGRGADVVVVCPGTPEAVQAGLDCAAPGARVVLFTPLPPDRPLTLDASALYFREVTLAQSYSCGPDETREALRLLERCAVVVDPLVTHTGGLADVGAALERAAGKGDGIKTIIHPQR